MTTNKKTNKLIINKDIIYFLFLILILVGKFVRHTIMKTNLVDVGIGHKWIYDILYGSAKITAFTETGISDASGNTVAIFQAINFFNLSTYIQFEIYISIVWNILLIGLLFKVKQKLQTGQAIFIILSIIVLNIFDFTLAKEPIQMLYFILIYFILISNKLSNKVKNVLCVLVIVLSSIYFRRYYLVIAFFAVLTQIVCTKEIITNKNIKLKTVCKILIYLAFVYFIVLNVSKIIMPGEYSELIRVRTRTSGVASEMRNILPSTNLVFFTLDYLIMLIRMLVPIELVPLGIKYIPYFAYQVMITYFVIKAMKNMKNNSYSKNLALFMYLGFLLGSATFEPDFGSWVRHEAVVFPILLIIADCLKERKINDTEKMEERNG